MRKRSWFTYLFLLAFIISWAHSAIPHSHPDKKNKSATSEADDHHHDHGHDHEKHGHDQDPTLPVFAHFSNADFIANLKHELPAKKAFLIETLEPLEFSYDLPAELLKQILFPRPREHPAGEFKSIQSLRAPPFFS